MRLGQFSGQGPGGAKGAVLFFRMGRDVLVTSPTGEFVTMLENGIENKFFQAGVVIQ